jgi:hypothetical protein
VTSVYQGLFSPRGKTLGTRLYGAFTLQVAIDLQAVFSWKKALKYRKKKGLEK